MEGAEGISADINLIPRQGCGELPNLNDNALQQEGAVEVSEEELVAEISSFHHELLQHSDLLSNVMKTYADKEEAFQYVLVEKEGIIEKLEADNKMYVAKLNDAEGFVQQLIQEQLSLKKELDDNNKEIMVQLNAKDEMLAKVKDELILKQECFDTTVNTQAIKLEELKEVIKEQSDEILSLQKEMKEREEELVVATNELSELHHKLTQQSDDMSAEIACKEAMKYELDDKERIIATLESYIVWCKAESNETKSFLQQLKFEEQSVKTALAKMEEKLRVTEEALVGLKEELATKQNCLDVTIRRQSVEQEEWQRQSQEQMDKILMLQKEVTKNEIDLVAAENKVCELNDQLVQTCDLLSAETAEKQKMLDILAEKERLIEKLQADSERCIAELNDAKDCIEQLKATHLLEKQNLQANSERCIAELNYAKECIEQLKATHLLEKQNLQANSERCIAELNDVKDCIEQLKVTHLLEKQNLQADSERCIAELNDVKDCIEQLKATHLLEKQKLTDNEQALSAKIRMKDETLTKLKEELVVKQNYLRDIVSNHSIELEGWQKESQEHSEKILILQKQTDEKDGKLAVIKQQIFRLNEQLADQVILLSAEKSEKQRIQNILASKEKQMNWKMVDKLDADNKMYRAQLDDAKDLVQQLKREQSNLNDELTQKSDLLSKEIANAQTLTNELADKEKTISQLKDDITTFQTEADDAKYQISQLEREYLSVKQKLVDDGKMTEELSAKNQALANSDQIIADKNETISKLLADIEAYKSDGKSLASNIEVEQPPTTQEVGDDETLQCKEESNATSGGALDEVKEHSLPNQAEVAQQGTTSKEEWAIKNDNEALQRSNITQGSSKEGSGCSLQEYKERYVRPLTANATIIMKIARTFEEETAYKAYITDILKATKATNLDLLQKPISGFKDKTIAVEVQRTLNRETSPEIEACKRALENCISYRDQLLSEVRKQAAMQ